MFRVRRRYSLSLDTTKTWLLLFFHWPRFRDMTEIPSYISIQSILIFKWMRCEKYVGFEKKWDS